MKGRKVDASDKSDRCEEYPGSAAGLGGLNETYGCTEAEYSGGMNFSARDFPALSTRLPRRRLQELAGLNGMYHLNGLLTVCGQDLVIPRTRPRPSPSP